VEAFRIQNIEKCIVNRSLLEATYSKQ